MISVRIIYKYNFEPARKEAQKLEKWLRNRAVAVFAHEMRAEGIGDGGLAVPRSIPETVDWVVVLGGDGTLLGAARQIGQSEVPILGVNLGSLGFLTSVPLEKLYPAIEMMLQGQLEMESRLKIETKVIRQGKELCRFQALNDVVINKGAVARIIDLNVFINDQFLTTFRADGLIIATPTGSTAYNLSAGGPILYPTMANIILTPICPFTLTNRPLILPDSDVISIKMKEESDVDVSLTFDGHTGFDFHYGDTVMISKSRERTKLIRPPEQSYFEILRAKLMWGGATYNANGDD